MKPTKKPTKKHILFSKTIDTKIYNSKKFIIVKIDAISDNLNKIPNDSKIDELIDLHKKNYDDFVIKTEKPGKIPFNKKNITKGIRKIFENYITVTPEPRSDKKYFDINISSYLVSEILDNIKNVFKDDNQRKKYGLQDYIFVSEEENI